MEKEKRLKELNSLYDFLTKDIEQNEIHKGEIWLVDLDLIIREGNHVQRGKRPCLVVDNPMACQYSGIIKVIALTSQVKTNLPTHVGLGEESGLIKKSIALCEYTIPSDRKSFIRKLSECPDFKMNEIDRALNIADGRINPKEISLDFINKNLYMYFESLERYNQYKDEFNKMVKDSALQSLSKYCYDYNIPINLLLEKRKIKYINITRTGVMVS